MASEPYLVKEILVYSDGAQKVVNFKPITPMSDDEPKVEEEAVEEASAEAVAESADVPASDAPADAPSAEGEPEAA